MSRYQIVSAAKQPSSQIESRARNRVAVLLPCYNEATTIADVVRGFRTALPDAAIYVYDNNSGDDTRACADGAGAIVRGESRQGKGHVVRRMFADIEADIYVMADGDDTYDPHYAGALIDDLVTRNLDMVVATRVGSADAYRRGHRFGNRLLNQIVGLLFGQGFTDMLSGYRVFSRRFVKSFPALTGGFEIETELSIHALELSLPVAETPVPYAARPEGSDSKLRTYRDGFKILRAIALLLKDIRPLWFFGFFFAVLVAAALGLAYPVYVTWLQTGLVPRLPTAVLSTGLMLLGFLSLASGFILDSVSRGRREAKRLRYLAMAPVLEDD